MKLYTEVIVVISYSFLLIYYYINKKASENDKLCILLLVKEEIDVNFNDSRLDLLFRRLYPVNYRRLTL